MANETVIIIPPNGMNFIQAPQIPVHYTRGNPSSQQECNPQQGPLKKFLKAVPKTLGAIQILIALLLIGFGSIAAVAYYPPYTPISVLSAYPYWGGIFFIISGSISVSAENYPSSGLVKCSVGTNITSAVMALMGIILYIAELVVNQCQLYPYWPEDQDVLELAKSVSTGTSILLLLFSLLQFCITVSTAHFGCQATCCNTDPDSVVFVPYQVNGSMVDSGESNLPPPPEYNAVNSASKAE